MNGRLPSQVLGLHLERDGTKLRLFDPMTGRRLLTSAERAEEAKRLGDEQRRLAEAAEAALDAENGKPMRFCRNSCKRPTGFAKSSKHFVVGRTLSERIPACDQTGASRWARIRIRPKRFPSGNTRSHLKPHVNSYRRRRKSPKASHSSSRSRKLRQVGRGGARTRPDARSAP